jgi:hypothetical protein
MGPEDRDKVPLVLNNLLTHLARTSAMHQYVMSQHTIRRRRALFKVVYRCAGTHYRVLYLLQEWSEWRKKTAYCTLHTLMAILTAITM